MKFELAIERKAVGWPVMDADKRVSEDSGEGTGAYSQCLAVHARGDKCRFSYRFWIEATNKGGNGKNCGNEKDQCKTFEKITSPPHWARMCTQAVWAEVHLTPSFMRLDSHTNSACSEVATGLAGMFKDILSPERSSDWQGSTTRGARQGGRLRGSTQDDDEHASVRSTRNAARI